LAMWWKLSLALRLGEKRKPTVIVRLTRETIRVNAHNVPRADAPL